jgi:hypothetical protein
MSDHVVWDPKSVEARLQFLRIVETEGIWSAREFLIRENTKFPKSIRAAISQIPHRSGPARPPRTNRRSEKPFDSSSSC